MDVIIHKESRETINKGQDGHFRRKISGLRAGIERPEGYEYSSARFYLQSIEDDHLKLSDFRVLL